MTKIYTAWFDITVPWDLNYNKHLYLVKDPDDNILIEFPYLGKGPNQHIFLPTDKFHETLYFYKNISTYSL